MIKSEFARSGVGVRPSRAQQRAQLRGYRKFHVACLSNIAAPEDGRIP